MVGAIPDGYGWSGGPPSLATQFTMARGGAVPGAGDMPALEMTKWFDTNYHYVAPRLAPRQSFELASTALIDAVTDASSLGYVTRPVLLGPVSYLRLARSTDPDHDPLDLLPGLLPVYEGILRRLAAAGVDWVQVDEPTLVLDTPGSVMTALRGAYDRLAAAAPSLRILLTTYFGSLRSTLRDVLALPVAGIHLDLVRGADQLAPALAAVPADRTLSLGVVDGRDVWRTDLDATLDLLEPVRDRLGSERLILGPSCSLLHLPIDVVTETQLDPVTRGSLAFAVQRIEELAVLARALSDGRDSVRGELEQARAAQTARRALPGVVDPTVRTRVAAIGPDDLRRHSVAGVRKSVQHTDLRLPSFPTTTIGSFPQTDDLRRARADHRAGTLDDAGYEGVLRAEIERVVRWQEGVGLDVLVHGEPERNDMVQYFAENLDGFAVTQNGWVQSYGSRCTRPSILWGDVSRPAPITVEWSTFTQSLTEKPVKGMLTGPVTILAWSFVRDDQPLRDTANQVALALRDEIADLESAGIGIIQVDEPALRELLPLKKKDHDDYLDWSVGSFRLATAGVADRTQIHTHLCYSEFGVVIDAINRLDADVTSIEAARSKMEVVPDIKASGFGRGIGPGVYDIHSPRVPSVDEVSDLIEIALGSIPDRQVWVNPDCGLKTRGYDETVQSLTNVLEATRAARAKANA
jgi:5-methyltetrahydropteroyltriglutamate--homocysteine methyltransferase